MRRTLLLGPLGHLNKNPSCIKPHVTYCILYNDFKSHSLVFYEILSKHCIKYKKRRGNVGCLVAWLNKTGSDPFVNLKVIFAYYTLYSCVHILLCVKWKGRLPHYLAITLFSVKIHYLLKNSLVCHIFQWNASIFFLSCGSPWLWHTVRVQGENQEMENMQCKQCDFDLLALNILMKSWRDA